MMAAAMFCRRTHSLVGGRSLCRRFMAVQASQAQQAPWVMMSSRDNPESRYMYEITADQTLRLNREIHLPTISNNACIGSTLDGFIFSIPSRFSPDIHALNPLTGDTLAVPPTATLSDMFYNDTVWYRRKIFELEEDEDDVDFKYDGLYVGKVVLSPSQDFLALRRSQKLDLARLPEGTWTPVPLFFSWERSPPQMSFYPDRVSIFPQLKDSTITPFVLYDDIAFHKGRLHAVDIDGYLAAVDPCTDPLLPSFLAHRPSDIPRGREKHPFLLVESPDGGDLFLLCRIAHIFPVGDDGGTSIGTKSFEVYRLLGGDGGDCCRWDRIHSIGDLALFVGGNQSLSLNACNFPNLKPNSIYFVDHYYPNDLDPEHIPDLGVFNVEDGSVRHFEMDIAPEEFNWPHPVWSIPAPASCL